MVEYSAVKALRRIKLKWQIIIKRNGKVIYSKKRKRDLHVWRGQSIFAYLLSQGVVGTNTAEWKAVASENDVMPDMGDDSGNPLDNEFNPPINCIGKALSFDGISNYVKVPHHSSITFTSENFSIAFWIKVLTLEWKGIIAKGAYKEDGWYVFIRPEGAIYFRVNQLNAQLSTVSYDGVLVKDVWEHVVVVRDGVKAYIYVNAVDETEFQPELIDPAESTKDLYIGSMNGGDNPINAVIDEVRIYNRALTPEEILYDYNTGRGRYVPYSIEGLVAWWHIDEGSGNTIYDETTNNNDGTIHGATWVSGKVWSPYFAPSITYDFQPTVKPSGGYQTYADIIIESTVISDGSKTLRKIGIIDMVAVPNMHIIVEDAVIPKDVILNDEIIIRYTTQLG